MAESEWHDLGPIEELRDPPLRQVKVGRTALAVSFRDGEFAVISGICNHVGGPLGDGRIDDAGYVVCPWHAYKFHRATGEGEPGFETDRVPSHAVKVEGGHLFVDLKPKTPRHKDPHEPHPLTRSTDRAPGPLRLAGISTTVMDKANPRYSTSEALLDHGLAHAAARGAEVRKIALVDRPFRACEGYYSKSARACTWPCSITQMDPDDGMEPVYEALVHWADAVVLATPIRWGAASSLYYKMAERLNCVQNQVTTHDRVLIRNKVASFIVTGGQDNVQAVAGQLLGFFGELGFLFPQFPYVAHSRGWTAEDMERNVAVVQKSTELREGTEALVERTLELAGKLIETREAPAKICRGGRKAHRMAAEVEE